jgi:bifunctional DNA-binding transcriptional regulator/antitoxin component of YhaV-PrlF toxin-antitoxin module
MRRKLNIAPNTSVQIVLRDGEIVLRRLLTIEELGGIFHDAVKGRKPIPWEKERELMEQAIAEEADRGR